MEFLWCWSFFNKFYLVLITEKQFLKEFNHTRKNYTLGVLQIMYTGSGFFKTQLTSSQKYFEGQLIEPFLHFHVQSIKVKAELETTLAKLSTKQRKKLNLENLFFRANYIILHCHMHKLHYSCLRFEKCHFFRLWY